MNQKGMRPMKLTEAEFLQAIQDAMTSAAAGLPDGPAGVTTEEVAKYLGASPERVSRKLASAVKAGYLEVERGHRFNVLGERHRPPVYRPVAGGE